VDGLKQRIIGALVLVSLAVIFVPMMFDEPHSERQTTTIKIPEEPPFPEVDMPEPDTKEPPGYRIEELDGASSGQSAGSGAESSQSTTESATTDSAVNQAPAQAPEPPEAVEGPSAAPETASGAPDQEPLTEEFTRSLEGAWVVQLGSFGSKENATRLREKVREKGYSSHLQQITTGGSELTRVFSGPFAEKAEAERAKQALDKAFGLNTLVTTGGK
jgi:DedD protein